MRNASNSRAMYSRKMDFRNRKHRMFHRIVIIVVSWEKIAGPEKKSIIQTSVLFDRLTKDSHFQKQNETFIFKMLVHLP